MLKTVRNTAAVMALAMGATAVLAIPAQASGGSPVGELTVFNCSREPAFVHVLATWTDGPVSNEVQTITLRAYQGQGVPTAIHYANTAGLWAQVDVISAPDYRPQSWLGTTWWNSTDYDLDITVRGTGQGAWEEHHGYQATPSC